MTARALISPSTSDKVRVDYLSEAKGDQGSNTK